MRLRTVHSQAELEDLIREVGFLPFFRNSIPGYSIEECTPRSLWFAPDADGPWEWKGPIAMGKTCAYGKFFQGKAGFISALYIVLVPFLRILRGGKVKLPAWVSVAVALVGMYLLCIQPGGDLSLGTGDLMVLISACFYSLHILSIDNFVTDTDPVLLSCLQFFVTGLISAGFAFGFEQTTMADIWACKWAILYAGVLSCGVAYTLQAVGQRYADPLQATLLMSTESVFSGLSGALVLGERFSGRELGGCVLILIAVIYGQCADSIGPALKKLSVRK